MTLIIALLALSTCLSHAEILGNGQNYQTLQANRRQGYSSSVLHADPKNPDLGGAKSTVKVEFNPGHSNTHSELSYNSKSKTSHGFTNHESSFHPIQNPANYHHNQNHHTSSSSNVQVIHHPAHAENNYQHHQQQQSVYNSQPSQLFNVGYSVSFDSPKPKPKPRPIQHHSNHKYENADIITGTRKAQEVVEKPDFKGTPMEFVETSLINNYKHKYSAPKEKYKYQTEDNKHSLHTAQAQKYSSNIENKGTYVQFKQETATRAPVPKKTGWHNLSPTVEIFRSNEVPANHKVENLKQSNHFDHAKALGKSQGFDYTNAIEGGLQNLKPNSYYDIAQYANSADLNAGQHEKNVVNPQYSAVIQYQQKPHDVSASQYIKPMNIPIYDAKNVKPIPLGLFSPNPKTQDTNAAASSNADEPILPKLPLDTSLLRNPVLIDPKGSSITDPKAIPIKIDTRLLEQALQKQFLENANQKNILAPSLYLKPEIANMNFQALTAQAPQEQFKKDQEYQPQQIQPQYLIYNPKLQLPPQQFQQQQPQVNLIHPNRVFMKSNQEDFLQRQPRFNTMRNARPANKDFNIQTRLRPPPLTVGQLQRRMYTGNY